MNASVLLHETGRVLAAIDPSVYATSVGEHAAWAATRLAAPLELMHAIDRRHGEPPARADLSGQLALGDGEALLQQLAELDQQRSRLALEQGRLLLEQLRTRIATDGLAIEIRQRHSELLEALLDLEAEVRLFVLGKRGEHADFARGHLGSNLERVVRAVHRPVLIASRAFKPPQRFLVAFDGSPTTRKCVEMICASPLLKGLQATVLLVGEDNREARERIGWAGQRLREAGFEPAQLVRKGTADAVISDTVREQQADLLVMGAYGHSRIRSLILGSTTTQVLRNCQVPVLLLR